VFFDDNLERLHFSFLLFVGIHLLTGQRVAMKKNVRLQETASEFTDTVEHIAPET
jgi:hypothetical protein